MMLDDELFANLNAEPEIIEVEIASLKDTISKLKEGLENVWKDDTSVAYELTSVFIHHFANLNAEPEIIEVEIASLKDTISKLKEGLENVWKDDTSVAYELTSVFIHRGSSPLFGHYFYSRHLPEQPDNWFKYNDHQVTEVPKSEILADTTGSTANPYLLVFAKKDRDVSTP
ncbi:cysteine proteinase [Rhizopogon salebrosus TDB-379]|nr:cysteine proteinase [Rhizopogon salebrosus TDB-379]